MSAEQQKRILGLLPKFQAELELKGRKPVGLIQHLKDLGFTEWGSTDIVNQALKHCTTSEEIQKIIVILPSGDEGIAGFNDKTIQHILEKNLLGAELYNILKLLDKFTGLNLNDYADLVIDEIKGDWNIVELIKSHRDFQNIDMTNILIQSYTTTLRQFINTVIYRNQQFEQELDQDTMELDRLLILYKLGTNQEEWPVVETLQTIINLLEFKGWSDPVTQDEGAPTFLKQLIEQCDTKTLPKVIDILPGEDAAEVGLTEDAVLIMTEKPHVARDTYLQNILTSLSKFTKGIDVKQLKDIAIKIMRENGEDVDVAQVFEAHPALQDLAVVNDFVHHPLSLKNFANIVAYRTEKFGIGLSPEDLLSVKDKLGTPGWSIEAILLSLQKLGFVEWGANLGNDQNILDIALNSPNLDIKQFENVLRIAGTIEGIVVSEASLGLILQKCYNHAERVGIVKIFNDSQNLDTASLVTYIQNSANHIDGATLIKYLDPAKAHSIIPVLVSTVNSVNELASLIAYTKGQFNIGLDTVIGEDGAALLTYLPAGMADDITKNNAEAIKNLPKIAIDLAQRRYEQESKHKLSIFTQLGFTGWNDVLGNGKTFLQIGLENCGDLFEVKLFLDTCAKYKLPIAINHGAIDAIFAKESRGHVDMKNIVTTLQNFDEVDWAALANKASEEHLEPNFWQRHWQQLPSPHYIPPIQLIKLIGNKNNPVVISIVVAKIRDIDNFEEIMTLCQQKFGMEFDMKVGKHSNHIITYLQRNLVDLDKISAIAKKSGSPINWASENNQGEMLAGQMVVKSDKWLLQRNVEFLLEQETDIDWNGPLESGGTQNNLLLLIANSSSVKEEGRDLSVIWNVISNLLQQKDLDGNPRFNINHASKSTADPESERLMDKIKSALGNSKTGRWPAPGQLDFSRTEALRIITELRNHGSVEPKQSIVTENLQIDKENIHSKQNDDAVTILLNQVLKKYHLIPNEIDQSHKEMLAAMEVHICESVLIDPTWAPDDKRIKECEAQRETLRNGKKNIDDGGMVWQAKRLIAKGKGDLAGGHELIWQWSSTIAHLWQAAKEFKIQQEFFSVFPGLKLCDWGLLINLFYPFCKHLMSADVQVIQYDAIIDKFSESIQKSALEKLKEKLGRGNEAKLTKIVSDAFVDFKEARNDLGGVLPENWKPGTQLLIAAFNEAFTQNIRSDRSIIGKKLDDIIESYHFNEYMKCFITSFITDPQSYRGPITGIYIDTINSIAGRLLTDLVRADPASAHDIIKKYSEENGILLDLSYISDVGMTKFLGDLGGQKIAVLKALNANKVKVSDEFEKTITSTLAKVKNAEFTAAINAIQNNDHTILTKFAQDWVLDKKTFDDCTKALIDIHPHKLQLLLATLSEAHYLKKEMHVTKNCRDQYKEIKKANTTELVQSILADVPNADELIDEFIRSLKLLDLNSMDIADIMKLLRTENDILINRLVTDDKILFDWSKLIEEGDNTDLLFTLANTAMMASNDDKIENLKKANTQNFVKNISQHQDPVVLVDQFIGMLGRLDLTLLETDEINALFNEDSEALINKILTTEGVIIDWSKPTGDAHHTFLYQLAHMREGKFEKAAIDIFNAHQEDWHLIGGVMPGGHVGLEFGDYIDQD